MDSKDRQIEELKALIATGFWKWFVKRNLFSFLLDSIEAKQMHQPAPTLLSASFLYMVQLAAKAFASVDEHTKYQGESVIDQYLDSIGLNTPEAILTRQAYSPAESYVIDKPTYRAAAMQPGGLGQCEPENSIPQDSEAGGRGSLVQIVPFDASDATDRARARFPPPCGLQLAR